MDALFIFILLVIVLVFVLERGKFQRRKKAPQKPDFSIGFHSVLLAICSQLLKVNGKPNKVGVNFLSTRLKKQFGKSYAYDRIVLLRSMMEKDYNTDGLCIRIRENSNEKFRKAFIKLLYQIASSDGFLSPMEALYLQRVNLALHLPPFKFEHARRWTSSPVRDPYHKLGISPGASDQEVKKAYRKFVLKFHPDRSASKNQQEDRFKFEEIQMAYETICKERNIK